MYKKEYDTKYFNIKYKNDIKYYIIVYIKL